jgi:tetratricopeptide (TPR) repeat protein
VLARAGHVIAYLGRDNNRAIRLLDEAVALNPNLASAWQSRGWVSVMSADPDRAIESFGRMVRLSPLDPFRVQAWLGTAFANMLLGQYDIGREHASKAIEVGEHGHSYAVFIVCAMLGGDRSDAHKAAQRLMHVRPAFRAAYSRSMFPVGSDVWQQKIEQCLVDAGIPP